MTIIFKNEFLHFLSTSTMSFTCVTLYNSHNSLKGSGCSYYPKDVDLETEAVRLYSFPKDINSKAVVETQV